jgi:RHS repeat-associated protein
MTKSNINGAVVRNDFGQYQHEYVLRDHLGNTRVTFRDGLNKGEPYDDWSNGWFPIPVNPNANNPSYDDGVVTKDDIVQINNYYPFGLNMEGDWNGASGKNKSQYNGKEWNDDFGLGWNDYGARFYDPAMARWHTVDPLSEISLQHNPYNYVTNNPIKFIDPDGMQTEGYISGKKGQLYHDKTVHSQKDIDKKYGEKSGLKYEGEEILLKDKAGNRYYGDKDGNVTGTTKEDAVITGQRGITWRDRLYSLIPATYSIGVDADAIYGGAVGGSYDLTFLAKGKDAPGIYLVSSYRAGTGAPASSDISVHASIGWLTGKKKFQQNATASDILNTKLAFVPDGKGGLMDSKSKSSYLSWCQ